MSGNHPIRVLWLIRGLGPGGAERLLVAQAGAAGAGISYEVAYQVAAKDQLVPELEAHGVVVHRLAGPRWPLDLRRLVADRRIDVVHSHSPAMAAPARVALRLLPGGQRPKLVYTEHNRWQAYRLPTRLANAVTFVLDHDAIAVSEEARSSILGPLRGRVETLHHGIDQRAVREAAGDPTETRAELGLGADERLAVLVANYRVEKAHEVAVEAARILADRGSSVRLAFVGQGPRRDEITGLIDREGLDDRILVLGYREDVPALISAADALVLSSDHEGLPVAIMEALTLGVPVVSTAVGGVPEVIIDGRNGLLVPPRDPEALADALARLGDDPGLRAHLATGATDAGAAFGARDVTERIEARYRRLSVGRRAAPVRPGGGA